MMEIVGLREALEEEERAEKKRATVAPLLVAGRQRLEMATKAKRLAELKLAADGHEVDPNQPNREVTEAQRQVDLYNEAQQTADKAAAAAAGRVTSLLRQELQRRARAAQVAYDAAVRDFEEAARKRQRSSEALATANGTVSHFPSEDLKVLFANDIAWCMADHEAKASA